MKIGRAFCFADNQASSLFYMYLSVAVTFFLVCFCYFSQELRELVRLHHEVQLLCFQLHVEELAGKKLLPLLEKMDPSDG